MLRERQDKMSRFNNDADLLLRVSKMRRVE